MPTHDEMAQFLREFVKLGDVEQDLFIDAMKMMVADLRAKRQMRTSLRVKAVQGHSGIFEMTWAADGRATFTFGAEQQPGETHIIWRRIGGHEILKNP